MRYLQKLGIFLIVIAIIPFLLEIKYLTHAKTTIGIVRNIQEKRQEGTQYNPVLIGSENPCKLTITFQINGRDMIFDDPSEFWPCSQFPNLLAYYKVGQEIGINYNPDNLQDIQINNFLGKWFFTLLPFVFGVFLLGSTRLVKSYKRNKSIKSKVVNQN